MAFIPFFKMQGSGNDFILIDNRQKFWTRIIWGILFPESVPGRFP